MIGKDYFQTPCRFICRSAGIHIPASLFLQPCQVWCQPLVQLHCFPKGDFIRAFAPGDAASTGGAGFSDGQPQGRAPIHLGPPLSRPFRGREPDAD